MAFFQFFRGYQIPVGNQGGSLEFTVPADKELIIEHVSGDGVLPNGQVLWINFQAISQGTTGSYFVIASKVGTDAEDFFIFSQPMRVHVDAGSTVSITVNRLSSGGAPGSGGGNFTMTGQLLDAGSEGTSVNF